MQTKKYLINTLNELIICMIITITTTKEKKVIRNVIKINL